MQVAAILVAAGSGSRFGAEMPKQFVPVAGKPVIRHAAETLAAHVALLQPVGDAAAIDAALTGLRHLPTVPGGATRQDSVRAGLEALAATEPDVVLVHDAARPLIPAGTIPALLAALRTRCRGDPRRPGRRYPEARDRRHDRRHGGARGAVSGSDSAGVPLSGAAGSAPHSHRRGRHRRRRAAGGDRERAWRSSRARRTTSS